MAEQLERAAQPDVPAPELAGAGGHTPQGRQLLARIFRYSTDRHAVVLSRDHQRGATCRGAWARATIVQSRHLALQTFHGHTVFTHMRRTLAVHGVRVGASVQQEPRRLQAADCRRHGKCGAVDFAPRRSPPAYQGVRVDARLGFGRIVASELEAPIVLVNLV